ncbi:hypothetical protein [Acinetobacter colistiniresistens]|uniref:hypothetical protein n=1 Tax=Acinetobacter colistiniresistens TaxID=280145 RepID=UPI002FE1D4DC
MSIQFEKLLSDEIYLFNREDRYWEFTSFDEPIYLQMYDDWLVYVCIPKDWRKSAETLEYARKEFLHYFISSVFTTRNAVLPLAWLSYTKYVLGMDYVPSDFQSLALKILEWFDLERYQAAYHLPQEEYDAIKHDLPLVIKEVVPHV